MYGAEQEFVRGTATVLRFTNLKGGHHLTKQIRSNQLETYNKDPSFWLSNEYIDILRDKVFLMTAAQNVQYTGLGKDGERTQYFYPQVTLLLNKKAAISKPDDWGFVVELGCDENSVLVPEDYDG